MTRAPADEVVLDNRQGGIPFCEYTRILRWYWMQIACLTIVGGAVAIGVAVGLPGKYRSSPTILVQQQQVPVDFVRPTITSFADERISTITQRVMTASVLGPMIERHGLYQEHRSRETLADLVDRMRQARHSHSSFNLGPTSSSRLNIVAMFVPAIICPMRNCGISRSLGARPVRARVPKP